MKKKLTLIILISLFLIAAKAQHTLEYTQADKPFYDGKSLFDQRKYAASYRAFEMFLETTSPTNAGMIQEAQYYLASNAYELRQANAETLLRTYVVKNPYTPYWARTQYMLGMLEFEKKDYQKALDFFRNINETDLSIKEMTDYLFVRGYANLATGNTQKALDIFKTLKAMNLPHQPTAIYYTGYSEYLLGNYDAALQDLQKIEHHPDFNDLAPYYITQIYYAKKDFAEMEKRATVLLKNNPENINNAELYRMIGEKAYADGHYAKAIENLKKYEKIFPQVLRNDMYYLGASYQKNNQPEEAIKYLSKVTTLQDEMAENAYLQLGNAYVSLNEINNARMAFETAVRTNFNNSVREDALYNYALTTYASDAPFGEAVSAFEQFIKEFPNSKNIDNAYHYLATTYLTSNNFTSAYASIKKIKNLPPQLRDTKQYLEYRLGTDAFVAGNYTNAVRAFTQAIQSSPSGKHLTDVYYWRGESYYRLGDYTKSASDLTRFLSLPDVAKNPNYTQAFYSLGYAYFGQKKYSKSINWFLKYLDKTPNKDTQIYADALNRLGDAYFSNRYFGKADEYYQKAQSNSINGDYSLFQSAYMDGLQNNYRQKISKLEKILTQAPNSTYGDDALYEIGRSYLMLEDNNKAIDAYKRLISRYPNSNLSPKAQLELGLVYFNLKDYGNAIPAFKDVVALYPASEEAKTALQSLETIYINTNRVDEYLGYTKSLGMSAESETVQRADSIMFIAAENLFLAKQYHKAIESLNSYLKRYCPSGKNCHTARFYLAESYYLTNEKTKASDEYNKVIAMRGNPNVEVAALRTAEITFDQKKYAEALRSFKILERVAQSVENKNIARLGVLRTSYFLNNSEATTQIATDIIKDPASTDAMRAEAFLNRAKVYAAKQKLNDALKDLLEIEIDTRLSIGAEVKFALADTYFKLNRLNDAENEVLDFAKRGTPHQYWLARSFIVLADVYIQKGDDFQAKQYLLSLQKNYTEPDDVQSEINKRLKSINLRAKSKVIN